MGTAATPAVVYLLQHSYSAQSAVLHLSLYTTILLVPKGGFKRHLFWVIWTYMKLYY